MRLTAGQQKIIKSAVARIVGADSRVWLFGSRADDARRGGDIDLLVETPHAIPSRVGALCRLGGAAMTSTVELPQPASPLTVARTRGDLADALGQNVDLVVNDGRYKRPIYAIARETGVRLA